MFRILYTSEAKERLAEIAKMDARSARITLDHIAKLPVTYPSDPFLKGPHFKGLRRNRLGKYRIIYRVLDKEKEIHILTIGLRKSVYK